MADSCDDDTPLTKIERLFCDMLSTDEYLKEPGFWDLLANEGLSIPTWTDCLLHDNYLKPSATALPLMSASPMLHSVYKSTHYNRPLPGAKARWVLNQIGIGSVLQMFMASDLRYKSSDFAAVVDPSSSDAECERTVETVDTMAGKIRDMMCGTIPMTPHHVLHISRAFDAVQEYDRCRLKAVYQSVRLATRELPTLRFVKHVPSKPSFYERLSDSELELAEALFCRDMSSEVSVAAKRGCLEKLMAIGMSSLVSKATMDIHQNEYACVKYDPPNQYPGIPSKGLKVYETVSFVIVSIVASRDSDAWIHVAKRTSQSVKRLKRHI